MNVRHAVLRSWLVRVACVTDPGSSQGRGILEVRALFCVSSTHLRVGFCFFFNCPKQCLQCRVLLEAWKSGRRFLADFRKAAGSRAPGFKFLVSRFPIWGAPWQAPWSPRVVLGFVQHPGSHLVVHWALLGLS